MGTCAGAADRYDNEGVADFLYRALCNVIAEARRDRRRERTRAVECVIQAGDFLECAGSEDVASSAQQKLL